MKVILDECLPKRLVGELPGHDVLTVAMVGWAGTQNGELLRRPTERPFLITEDKLTIVTKSR